MTIDLFSGSLEFPAGTRLAGFADRVDLPTAAGGHLQAHGLRLVDALSGEPFELVSIDALYAGALVERCAAERGRRVFAASHTHYAPMLDPTKPLLGHVDEAAIAAWARLVVDTRRATVSPDRCVVHRVDVPVPIYRRFDYPDSLINRFLTRHAGFYPNGAQPIDRGLYLVVFLEGDRPVASLAYHACHATSRASSERVSPDYIGAVRDAVRQRFGLDHCVFLLGCTGDVRPDVATRRLRALPRGRLNWRFRSPPTREDQAAIDDAYRAAVLAAPVIDSFALADAPIRWRVDTLAVDGAPPVDVPVLALGDRLRFEFLPFELSHRFRLAQLAAPEGWRRLFVSCADRTRGYLPFPDQLAAGGYEVDASRPYMGLANRLTAPPALR